MCDISIYNSIYLLSSTISFSFPLALALALPLYVSLFLSLYIYISIHLSIYLYLFIFLFYLYMSLDFPLALAMLLRPAPSRLGSLQGFTNKEHDPLCGWFVEKPRVRDPVRYGWLLIKETVRYFRLRQCDFTVLHLAVKTLVRRLPYRTGSRTCFP